MHVIFLCCRYLQKRRIAFFGIAAVGLCVALLIVITSLFSGFVASFLDYSDRVFGQVVLSPSVPIRNSDELCKKLRQLDCVASARPIVQMPALLYLGRGNVRAVQLLGVDLEAQCQDVMFRRGLLLQGGSDTGNVSNGKMSFALSDEAKRAARQWLQRRLRREVSDKDMPVGAVMGIGVLARPDELTDKYDYQHIIANLQNRKVGLSITTGQAGGNEATSVKRAMCWPVNVVQTGLHEADTAFVYLPFDYVAELVGQHDNNGNTYCSLTVQVTGIPSADKKVVISEVKRVWRQFARQNCPWPPIESVDIDKLLRETSVYASGDTYRVLLFTSEIRKQLAILQVMLGLICLVVALLVFVIFFMMVTHKRRDVGILRSVGSSKKSIAGIFLSFGVAVGIVGGALGLALGVLATRNITAIESLLTQLLGFKVWKSGVYMFSDIPNSVAWDKVPWILGIGVVSAVVGALLPAIRASRMQAAEALRCE